MNQTFRCCKKEFNNFVCIVCNNVLHPSCKARMKIHKSLKGHRVYCSLECVEADQNGSNLRRYLLEIEAKNKLIRDLEAELEKTKQENMAIKN